MHSMLITLHLSYGCLYGCSRDMYFMFRKEQKITFEDILVYYWFTLKQLYKVVTPAGSQAVFF